MAPPQYMQQGQPHMQQMAPGLQMVLNPAMGVNQQQVQVQMAPGQQFTHTNGQQGMQLQQVSSGDGGAASDSLEDGAFWNARRERPALPPPPSFAHTHS